MVEAVALEIFAVFLDRIAEIDGLAKMTLGEYLKDFRARKALKLKVLEDALHEYSPGSQGRHGKNRAGGDVGQGELPYNQRPWLANLSRS